MDFIEKEIKKNKYVPNSKYNIDNIDCNYLELISKNFTSGPNMASIYVTINQIISKYTSYNGFTNIGIYNYITDVKYKASGNYGIVVSSNWFKNLDIISKNIYTDDFLREYFIGIFGVNKLRYTIPTFMYTYGYYRSDRNNDIIYKIINKIYPMDHAENYFLLENIEGTTLNDSLNKISYSQFIHILVQILLSLEIAQREICFCHYDLHCGNIILRKIDKSMNYTVILDNKEYNITCKKNVPTIIDFGLSCFRYKDKNIGTENFDYVNNYLQPCFDIYRLFISILLNTKNALILIFIRDIFLNVFGEDDPYKIFINKKLSKENLDNCASEWAVKLIKPIKINTITPKIILDYILENNNVSDITITNRKKFTNISNFNLEKILLNNIFSIGNNDLDSITINNFVKKCLLNFNNNILTDKYLQYIYNSVIEKNNLVNTDIIYNSYSDNIQINININDLINNFSKLLNYYEKIILIKNKNIDITDLKNLFYNLSQIYEIYYCYIELRDKMLIKKIDSLENINTNIDYNKYYQIIRWKNVLDNNNFKIEKKSFYQKIL